MMAITVDSLKKVITIHTDHSSYQMQIDRFGYLIHLYYGQRTAELMDHLLVYADRGFSGNPYDAGRDRTYSLDSLPQEYPSQGTGDYRSPMLVVKDSHGTYGCDLRYRSHEIIRGKYSLDGLPAVYSDSGRDDAETLRIVLENKRTGVEVSLLYGVLPHLDIITRAAVVANRGDETFTVERLGSANLDFTAGGFDLMTFYGRHAMERIPERRPLAHGETVIGSRRGFSSHQFNPMMILLDRDTTETEGNCWSMQLVYSGGFRAVAELDQYGQTRMQMGLADEKFSYPLKPGESLTAPEVIMSFSGAGLGPLSHHLHQCIRRHVCRGRHRDRIRPVLINSWEACFFDFTGDMLVELSREARSLGIEMLVMDDGWFGARNDDYRSLGDWYPNEDKLGCSLGELIRRINQEGLKFGIWIEPEMVSEDSDLYRAHPNWALAIPGEKPVRGRYQLVLDLSRREVVDAVYESICRILDQGPVEYLKWDCNRSVAEAYSHSAQDQGRVLYDYMLGLYDILERLNQRYPELLIEGCSGGGGRFDAGMLYYTPQIWCSDNTDAVDRLLIQYGTSFGYPASAIGAHVSACPNYLTGRTTPLRTRAVAAMGGTFGYELRLSALTSAERDEIRRQIADFHRYADLIYSGTYYRLTDPVHNPVCAWEYVSEDKTEALICAVILERGDSSSAAALRLRGLRPESVYTDMITGVKYEADVLTDNGLQLPDTLTDGDSMVYHLKL